MSSLETRTKMRKTYLGAASHWSDLGHHLPYIYEATATYTEPLVIELGVRSGVSTTGFLRAVAERGGHVHSVDIHHPNVPIWWADTGLWDFHVGDDLSDEILAALPSEVDIVFIDTSHFYAQTLSELRQYVPRVRPGGLVLLHDTELETPEGFTGDPYPVRRALDDYCAATGRTWQNRPGDSGLGVIRIP